MTNIAAYIKSLPDIVYWIIRDRFKESGSQQFTNYLDIVLSVMLKNY